MSEGSAQSDFREARVEEAPAIARFQIAMAHETEGLALDAGACGRGVRAVFDDPGKGRYYVAAVGGEIAGALLVTPEWSDWREGTIWWIQSVYVVPERRGRKLFSGLYVDKRNLAAKKIYGALGMDGGHYELFEWLKPSRSGRVRT